MQSSTKKILIQPFSHLIVTGGTGYIGSELVRMAVDLGLTVTLLGRLAKSSHSHVRVVEWSIGDPLPSTVLLGTSSPERTAVIHLAHDWNTSSPTDLCKDNLNIKASKTLLDSSRKLGVKRFIFASSQSARQDAPNIYGRVKWQIEQLLCSDGVACARVGLVYGGKRSGMFGLLYKLTKLPILPMISPSKLVQPIHLKEVCEGLLALTQSGISGCKGLADQAPVRFGDFLKNLSRIEHGANLLILPIPLKLALAGSYITKYVPGIPTVDRERILGLAGTTPIQTKNDLADLDLVLGAFNAHSTSALGVKGLLVEGNALLKYVLGVYPSRSVLKRYVYGLINSPIPQSPIGLPRLMIIFPILIGLIEPFSKANSLAKRLEIASTLSEFSIEGWQVFFNTKKQSRLLRLISLFFMIILGLCSFPFRWLLNCKIKK